MQAGHQFGEQGFIGAAVAEILGDGANQCFTLVAEQVAQGVEPLDALLGRGHRVGLEGLALQGKVLLQLAELLLALLQALFKVSDVGDHVIAPRHSSGAVRQMG